MFKLQYSKTAVKQLTKLDAKTREIIYSWIDKNLNNCVNPRTYGKPLTGDKKGLWRYRVGNYRIVAKIIDKDVTILIVEIGHRREVYN